MRRLVVASSLSAHGAPRKGQPPVSDRTAPEADPDHFYFREKAEVETLLDRWQATNLERPACITRLRPGFVYGPDFSNPALRLMGTRLAVVLDDGGRTQLVHQDELARAFCEAAFRDLPGAFLLVTDDSIALEDLAALSGGRVVRVPRALARIALDAAHALRLSPVAGDWAVSGDRVGRLGEARAALGFEPALSSRESALVLAQHGRRLRCRWPAAQARRRAHAGDPDSADPGGARAQSGARGARPRPRARAARARVGAPIADSRSISSAIRSIRLPGPSSSLPDSATIRAAICWRPRSPSAASTLCSSTARGTGSRRAPAATRRLPPTSGCSSWRSGWRARAQTPR